MRDVYYGGIPRIWTTSDTVGSWMDVDIFMLTSFFRYHYTRSVWTPISLVRVITTTSPISLSSCSTPRKSLI